MVNFVVPPSLSNIGAGTLAVDLPLAAGKNITLSGAGKVVFGSSGSGTAANREAVGTAAGINYNVPTGLAHTFLANNSACLTVSAANVTAAGEVVAGSSKGFIGYGAVFNNNLGPLSGYSEASVAQIYRNSVDLYINTVNAINFRIGGTDYMTLDGGGYFLATRQKLPTATPGSAAAAGTTGQIYWDSSYIYICTATNTWKRVAIATW